MTTVVARTPDVAPASGPLARVGRAVVLLVAAVGDAVNFKSALGEVSAALSDKQVWSAVVALTIATVGLMHFAGVSARKGRLAGLHWVRLLPVAVLGVLWLALGVCTALLRLAVPEGGGDVLAALTETATVPAATGSGPLSEQYAVTLLMFALFLATGGLAAWAAYNGHDPVERTGVRRVVAAVSARLAARARRRTLRALETAEHLAHEQLLLHAAAHTDAVERRAQLDREVDRCEERHQSDLQANDAWVEELRDHARLRLATVLGDPATTTALTAPHLPRRTAAPSGP